MLGLFFVVIFLELPEHKDKTKAEINQKTDFGTDMKQC